jgi:exonuclease III
VVVMHVISWNVRGLGGSEKRREVSNMVREKNPFILCLQESKLSVVNDLVCKAIWNDDNVEFSYQSSRGASGGLITLWNRNEVEVWFSFNMEHVLGVQGQFVKTGEQFTLFNVYAPCDTLSQQLLWQNLSARLASLSEANVCLCGDFNAVRCAEERKSVGSVNINVSGSANFNNMIENNCLIDLPLRGRRFTWYRGDGRSMSRIDRFLLSENWCLTWPNCFQMASSRGLSDHCPIQLCVDIANWGPKPVRMLKCWETFSGYDSFVREKWSTFHLEGWGGFVLKEKLKLIKLALKEWHVKH